MQRRNKIFFLITLLILMSSIIIYEGHFLFTEKKEPEVKNKKIAAISPILYKHISKTINGFKQEINILEVDLQDSRVSVKPVLSYDNIFGFEALSSIAKRSNAYAAINAGFFHIYGNPGGAVYINGKILTMSDGKFPVLIINNGNVELRKFISAVLLNCSGNNIKIDGINTFNPVSGSILFTREFGSDNRIQAENISVTIINNEITEIGKYEGKVSIPDNGMVLTFLKPYKYDFDKLPLKISDTVRLLTYPHLGKGCNAYECGSFILRDGEIVLKDSDPLVGVMSNHDPRTIVGIKSDGKLVFITVDGRQPGFSTGMTGRELGDFLLEYGIKNAAMLDGGASTEMILKGKIVNKPSSGQERPVGGGIVVCYD